MLDDDVVHEFVSYIFYRGDSRARSTKLRILKQHRNLSIWSSTLYRLTILQCLIACMCFHSNAFHIIVLHVCVYVYFRQTPSRRGSQCNDACSRIILELNLIKVAMFVMSDALILDIHSTEILYYLYHFFVGSPYLSKLVTIICRGTRASCISWSCRFKCRNLHRYCMMLYLCFKCWSVHRYLYDAKFMSYHAHEITGFVR